MRFSKGCLFKQYFTLFPCFIYLFFLLLIFSKTLEFSHRNESTSDLGFLNAVLESKLGPSTGQMPIHNYKYKKTPSNLVPFAVTEGGVLSMRELMVQDTADSVVLVLMHFPTLNLRMPDARVSGHSSE